MQKTTNYQLNQWEPSDPIRREDFNADNAAIDAAIDGAVKAAEKQAAAAGSAWAPLLRQMGYDLYQSAARSLCAGVSGVTLKGAATNCLKSADEQSRASGMLHLSGGGCMLGASTAMTMDKLNAAIYHWESVEALEVVEPAAQRVKFKSTFAGTITSLNVWYYRTSYNVINLPVVVRLYDLESGECVYESAELTGARLSAATTADTLTVAVPVEANHDYQLEVYTRGGAFYGTIGFGTYGTQALTGTVTGMVLTDGTVTETLEPETAVSQVVAVIHHTGGQVTGAAVNGETMTVTAAREGTSLSGTACTEQELFWEGEMISTAELTVGFQTDSADMMVHDVQFFCV